MSTQDTPLSALSWIRKFHFGWTDAEVRQAEIDEAPEAAPVVPEDHPTTTYSAKLLFELWHLQDYGDYRAQAAIAAQAQQAQGVPSRDDAIRVWRKHCRPFVAQLGNAPPSCVIDAMMELATAPQADHIADASKLVGQAQGVPEAAEYRRGWDECMKLWADHMKRMNEALNAPSKVGYANRAAELYHNVKAAVDAAPQAEPQTLAVAHQPETAMPADNTFNTAFLKLQEISAEAGAVKGYWPGDSDRIERVVKLANEVIEVLMQAPSGDFTHEEYIALTNPGALKPLEVGFGSQESQPPVQHTATAPQADHIADASKLVGQAQGVPEAAEYRRGWDECMKLWADHMKRMNEALNAPSKVGYANRAAELYHNVKAAVDAAPQAEPQPVHRRHTDAEALSCADRLNRSFPPSSLKDEAADHIRELVAASAEPQPEREPLSRAALDVLTERQRQISVEGWTAAHDDEHSHGEMAKAASAYAWGASYPTILGAGNPPDWWPWDAEWWKPSTPRRNLIKAGAIILAEIERLDRAGGGA